MTGMGLAGRGPLSDRQVQVLTLVADGRTDAEISRRLGISTATGRKHVGNILQRLGARSRAHAVAVALREGFID